MSAGPSSQQSARSGGWLRLRVRSLRANPHIERIAANSGWLLAERALLMMVGFAVSIWVARYLGPEQLGKLSYAVSLVGLLGAVASLGLDSIVIRDLVRKPVEEEGLIATAGALRLGAGIVSAALAFVIGWWLNRGEVTAVLVALVALDLVTRAFAVPELWFQAKVRSKYAVWARSISLLLVSATKLLLIAAGVSVLGFAALVPVAGALTGIGMLLAYRRFGPRPMRWRVHGTIAKRLLRDAWPLLVSGVAVVIYHKIDQVMLGEMVGKHEVGVYAIAVQLSELGYFLPMILAGSLFPALVEIKMHQSAELYRRRVQQLYDLMAAIAFVVTVPVVLLARPVVSLLFGEEYAAAASVLEIHIWAFMFVSLGVARSRWMVAEGMMRLTMITTLAGAVANVALNLVLLPRWGGVGAAWATLLSMGLAAYGSCGFFPSLWPALRQMTLALLLPLRLVANPRLFQIR